jgi:predicted AlkP superfamily pyrophosphatase or phosphodiesterase
MSAPDHSLLPYLRLVRFPAVFSAIGDLLAGALIARGVLPPRRAAQAAGAAAALYLAGMALNDLADREEDARERPERPIPSGAVSVGEAAALGSALLLAGMVTARGAGAGRTGTMLAGAIIAYNFALKHSAILGPAAMGGCRALSLLMGAETAGGGRGVRKATGAAGLLGAYVAGITLLARGETGEPESRTVAAGVGLTAASLLGAVAVGGRRAIPWALGAIALAGPAANRTVVLNVVGLTADLLGEATPNLLALARDGGMRPLRTVLPAVTCSVQATFTTGLLPRDHGAVANGWYFRDLSEVWFWRQSNRLVTGEKLWEAAKRRNPAFTCAKLFWWYNMYSSADYSVTPRPLYPADGRKIPDIYAEPPELRDELNTRLGSFPLFNFWGPKADIASSRWIADCARYIYDVRRPTLTLVYLPHLDYNLQRLGPEDARIQTDLREIDAVSGELIAHVQRDGARVVVISEYGITPVCGAVHINRVLREAGLLRIKPELGREMLDAGASEAFAVADHQVAHVYVRSPARVPEVKRLLEGVEGIETVLDEEGKRAHGLDHPRSGELVAVSAADRWFTYYYWFNDERAPDFARTVDIHRKPGYDPVELFLDPALRLPALKVGWTLARKALGFRYLMDVIPLDASLVRGSHGRITDDPDAGPVFISSEPSLLPEGNVPATGVKDLLLQHVFGVRPARAMETSRHTKGSKLGGIS